MSCWSTLGISPTSDQQVIKKAYAAAAKKHHPEEDPAGFIQVKKAYQQALAQSKILLQEDIDIPDGTEHIPSSLAGAGRSTIDFSVLQHPEDPSFIESTFDPEEEKAIDYTKLQQQEPEPTEDNESAPLLYDDLVNQAESILAERRRALLETAQAITRSAKQCKKNLVWKDFFESNEFLDLQKDRQFSLEFLRLIYKNRLNFGQSYKLNDILISFMKSWMLIWAQDGVIKREYNQLAMYAYTIHVDYHKKRKNIVKGSAILILGSLLILLIVILHSRHEDGSTKHAATYTPPPMVDKDRDDYDPSSQLSQGPALVFAAITEGKTYKECAVQMNLFGVSEEDYVNLQQIYTVGGETLLREAIEKLLSECQGSSTDSNDVQADADSPLNSASNEAYREYLDDPVDYWDRAWIYFIFEAITFDQPYEAYGELLQSRSISEADCIALKQVYAESGESALLDDISRLISANPLWSDASSDAAQSGEGNPDSNRPAEVYSEYLSNPAAYWKRSKTYIVYEVIVQHQFYDDHKDSLKSMGVSKKDFEYFQQIYAENGRIALLDAITNLLSENSGASSSAPSP